VRCQWVLLKSISDESDQLDGPYWYDSAMEETYGRCDHIHHIAH